LRAHGLRAAGSGLHRARHDRQGWVLLLLACSMLAAGAALYVFERRPGSAAALPALLEMGSGQAGSVWSGSFPSLAHAFAFSLLSCLLLPRRLPWIAAACALWAAVNAVFEVLQWPALAQPVAAALRAAGAPELPAAYLLQGRFDPVDLVASGLGAALAFAVAHRLLLPRSNTSCQEPTP
jgi:hypothetical protein